MQQTLCLAVLTLGQMHELLEVVDFFDALMPEKVPGADRKGVLFYKSQLIELQTMIHASDTIMAHEGDGLTPLAVRAYLMNVTPYALAKALTTYVTLERGYYATHYYPEVPLDWMMTNQQVVSLVSILNGNAKLSSSRNYNGQSDTILAQRKLFNNHFMLILNQKKLFLGISG